MYVLLFLLGFTSSTAHAEVCTPPVRTASLASPCDLKNDQPWLEKCPAFYTRFADALDGVFASRMLQLYEQHQDVDLAPPASVPAVCNISAGETCGEGFQPESSSPGEIILKKPKLSRTHAIRWGAWIHASEWAKAQILSEIQSGNLSVSQECSQPALLYSQTLESLQDQDLGLSEQPNRTALAEEKSACRSLQGNGSDGVIFQNEMSGCYLHSARTRIQFAFLQIAVCEIRARATHVDQEVFEPHSTCPNAKKDPSKSLFQQMYEKQFLTQVCEKKAFQTCSKSPTAACPTLTPELTPVDDPNCWDCLSAQIKSCVKDSSLERQFFQFLLPQDYPANVSTLNPSAGTFEGLAIQYKIELETCGPHRRGCPNASTLLIMDTLEKNLSTLLPEPTQQSPLEQAVQMNTPSQEENLDWVRAIPLELRF